MRPIRKPRQHLSHRKLVDIVEPAHATDSRIDAVLVPSARPAHSLGPAAKLARELSRPLVVFCSRQSRRHEVLSFIRSQAPEVVVYAIDTPPPGQPPHRALRFSTNAITAGNIFDRRTDTSLKRNLALLLARSVGWQRVLFLDDDVVISDAADVRRAGSSLDDHAVVGLRIGGFPDNSVVCHAIRETGGAQDTFVGGGALAVKVDGPISFFPNVYNEDWFFLLDEANLRPVTMTSKIVALQQAYDPFADPIRAAQEEFGDVLAEGALAILDDGGRISDADTRYWETFLGSRAELIGDVASRVAHPESPLESGARARMLNSLAAAQRSLGQITPDLCFRYMQAREVDLKSWRISFERTPVKLSLPDALSRLGLRNRWISNETAARTGRAIRVSIDPAFVSATAGAATR